MQMAQTVRYMMEQSMILNFFGGVSQDPSSWTVDFDKVLRELAGWLLPIGICLLAEGLWLEKWRKIEPLASYRYVTVKKWWRQKFIKNLRNSVLTAAVLFVTAMAADTVSHGELSDKSWKVLLLWLVHMIMTMTFFMLLDLTGARKLAPAILLLEGGTFLVGFSNRRMARFMFGMWGMYCQSEWYFQDSGIPVLSSLLIEMTLIALVYVAGGIFLERKGKGFLYGRDCQN